MPLVLNSCLFQLAYGKIGSLIRHLLKVAVSKNLSMMLNEDLLCVCVSVCMCV